MAKVETKHIEINASTSYSLLRSNITYSNINSGVDYQDAVATNVFLDPDTLNRYFRLDTISFVDTPSIGLTKAVTDTIESITDAAPVINLNKAASDELSIGDVALIQLLIKRSFSNTVEITDSSVRSIYLNKVDSIGGFDQITSIDSSKLLEDTPVLSDSPAIDFETFFTDTTSLSEQLSRVVSYARSFTDTSSITDVLVNLTGKVVEDTFPVQENFSRVVSFSRAFVATTSLTETSVQLFGKNLFDTTTISESFSRNLNYVRVFTDSFTLDDFANVGGVIKDTTASKSNIVGFTDSQVFSTSKALTDAPVMLEDASILQQKPASSELSVSDVFQKVTSYSRLPSESFGVTDSELITFGKGVFDSATVSESFNSTVSYNRVFSDAVSFASDTVAAFEKSLSDSVGISESINVQVVSLASSVLNAGALNSSSLNN